MDFQQLHRQFQGLIDGFNIHFSAFFSFVAGKLHTYPTLTVGEQIAYAAIGLGILLMLASLVAVII